MIQCKVAKTISLSSEPDIILSAMLEQLLCTSNVAVSCFRHFRVKTNAKPENVSVKDLQCLTSRFAQSKKPLDKSGFQIPRSGLVLCLGSRSSTQKQGFQPSEGTNELGFQLFVVQCNSPKLSPSCSISENELNQTLSIVWLKFPNVVSDLEATGTPVLTSGIGG